MAKGQSSLDARHIHRPQKRRGAWAGLFIRLGKILQAI